MNTSSNKPYTYQEAADRLSYALVNFEAFRSSFESILSAEQLKCAREAMIASELAETGWTAEELMN